MSQKFCVDISVGFIIDNAPFFTDKEDKSASYSVTRLPYKEEMS